MLRGKAAVRGYSDMGRLAWRVLVPGHATRADSQARFIE